MFEFLTKFLSSYYISYHKFLLFMVLPTYHLSSFTQISYSFQIITFKFSIKQVSCSFSFSLSHLLYKKLITISLSKSWMFCAQISSSFSGNLLHLLSNQFLTFSKSPHCSPVFKFLIVFLSFHYISYKINFYLFTVIMLDHLYCKLLTYSQSSHCLLYTQISLFFSHSGTYSISSSILFIYLLFCHYTIYVSFMIMYVGYFIFSGFLLYFLSQ